ncbi:signal protein (plasmid) [Embleya sp. NBC_00888]|uniref:signal protein n=1 Tax=Embleya sp. NBC_00888 TaxID=2975960 RepID=UPI002F9105BF|nr:signal protein [Embleya sp. NBC_00888]
MTSLSACESTGEEATATSTADRIANLQERWWQWSAQSSAHSPYTDATGERCSQRQPDDVWFLIPAPGVDIKRKCTVPAGRAVVGPVLTTTADDSEACNQYLAGSAGDVALDDKSIGVKKLGPEQVSFTSPADNPLTEESGGISTQACGLWFTLPPLSPGNHKLIISSRSGTPSFVEYSLTITR